MTLYGILLEPVGLSVEDAAEYHPASAHIVRAWICGEREPSTGALNQMRNLAEQQRRAAHVLAHAMAVKHTRQLALGHLTWPLPTCEETARSDGWPCLAALQRVHAMALSETAVPITLAAAGRSAADLETEMRDAD